MHHGLALPWQYQERAPASPRLPTEIQVELRKGWACTGARKRPLQHLDYPTMVFKEVHTDMEEKLSHMSLRGTIKTVKATIFVLLCIALTRPAPHLALPSTMQAKYDAGGYLAGLFSETHVGTTDMLNVGLGLKKYGNE